MQKKHVDPVTLKAGRCDAKSPETCPKMASVPPNKREQYHFEDDGNPAAVAVAIGGGLLADSITNAAAKSKCIEFHFLMPSVVQPKIILTRWKTEAC